GLFDDFNNFINDENIIEKTLCQLRKLDLLSVRNLKSEKNYFIHQVLYSALISADKLSASETYIPEEMYANYEELNIVRKQKFGTPKKSIDKIRTEIYEEVLINIE